MIKLDNVFNLEKLKLPTSGEGHGIRKLVAKPRESTLLSGFQRQTLFGNMYLGQTLDFGHLLAPLAFPFFRHLFVLARCLERLEPLLFLGIAACQLGARATKTLLTA